MQSLEPLVGLARNLALVGQPSICFQRGEKKMTSVAQIPVPQTVVCAANRQRVALLALAERRLGLLPRQLRLDPRDRDGQVHGLGDVVVRAAVQGFDDVGALLPGRHHDDRKLARRALLPDRSQHVEAADARHLDVEQDEREVSCLDERQRLRPVHRGQRRR